MKTSAPSKMAELLHCREELLRCLREECIIALDSIEVQTLKGALAFIEQTIREIHTRNSGRQQIIHMQAAA
jgi:hypothetical protein